MSKFTTGKVKLPVINKSISRKNLLILMILGGASAYLILGKKPTKGDIKVVARAPNVNATLTPNVVRPNAFLNVSGVFTDNNNQPVKTQQAMYYVFQRDTLEGIKLVNSGLIGTNIDRFQKSISTVGFPVGQYLLVITDEGPLSFQDLGGLNAGPVGGGGIGAGPFGPGTSTTVPTAGQGVTIG